MSFIKQPGTEPDELAEVEIESNIPELVRPDSGNPRQVEEDSDVVANYLSSLLRRVSANSTREIDDRINELQTLRDRLHRVERKIVEHTALNQSVSQLMTIVADSVRHMK
jgi:hypothetical protein